MTVSSTTSRVSYSGNGSTKAFAVNFYFLADSHLKVVLRAADGTETVKTLTTDYTVSGAGNLAGGTVTMNVAPATGTTLVIVRNVPFTQETDYQANDPFPAESHERALDKLTMEMQQLNEEMARTLKYSTGNSYTTTEIVNNPANRANLVLGFDASGELIVTQELGTFRGNWASGTLYYVRDIVKDPSNNNIYICVTSHTSNGSAPIKTNAGAGNWSLIVDAEAVSQSAADAAASAALAEDWAIKTDGPVAGGEYSSKYWATSPDVITVSSNIADINTVATNIANVNTVAGIDTEVTTVSGISTNVTTVANVSADVTTVAGIAPNVTAVAAIDTDVSSVADNIAAVVTVANDLNEPVSEIDTVATNIDVVDVVGSDLAGNGFNYDMGSITMPPVGPGAAPPGYIITVYDNLTDITTVADISADVTSVAGGITNVNTVAGISADVTTVAGIAPNVTTVAGVSTDVTAVSAITGDVTVVAGIDTEVTTVSGINAAVSTVSGISGNVTTVAGISSNVTTVAGISGNVTTVAGIAPNVTTVAGISSNVTTVAGISAAVSTTAANVTDVTNFADVYYGPSATDPVARRDGSALVSGDLYFNTVNGTMRVYNGVSWLDVSSTVSTPYQSFSGTGSQTAFTLNTAPGSLGNLEVYISGVRQTPTTDYTLSNTTMTFTSAPPSGTNNIFARWITTNSIGTPSDGTVTSAKLATTLDLGVL